MTDKQLQLQLAIAFALRKLLAVKGYRGCDEDTALADAIKSIVG